MRFRAKKRLIMPSSPLNVAVIGTGYFGSFHARIYHAMPDVHLVGVADIDIEAARRVAAKYDCAASADPFAYVGKVDAVSVAVPAVQHCAASLPYLEAGQAVLLEKPLAASMEDAERIVKAARKSGALLLPGYLERHNPAFQALAEALDGIPYFMEFQRVGLIGQQRAIDVDVITDLMIHDLDICTALTGASAASFVHAVGANALTGLTDMVNARIEFVNGSVANLTASRAAGKSLRQARIIDRQKYMALDFQHQLLHTQRRNEKGGISGETIKVVTARPLNEELAHFASCARRGETCGLVSPEEALASLNLALQIGAAVKQHTEKISKKEAANR